MENDKKILALLLGSAWFSSSNIYGDISALIHHTNGETAYGTVQQQAVLQRQATFNSITEILNALPTYKNKKQSEKDKFAALYTAIVLSAPEASKTLSFTNDEEIPKLDTTVATHLSKALTQVLTSPKADKIWSDSVSQTTSTNNLLYNALAKPLNSNSSLTLKPLSEKKQQVETSSAKQVTAPVVATAAPITHLVYTGQDLSQYPSLVSISITMDQLNGGTDITSTKSLEITVTGDATSAPLNTQRLAVPNAKIDLSTVTNLTNVTVTHADTTSVKLPNTVTSLTVSTATQVTGATALTTLNPTGAAPVPTWATDGSLTATNATLDLSAMTNLPATLDLSAISSDITTVKFPTSNTPNITNVVLPQTVNTIQNLPTTVTHLTANVPALASIGAYGKGTFRTHITHVTVVNSTTTSILKDFLRDNINLISVDLSRLTAVTSIDEDFFNGCVGLSSLDLSGLSNLNSVGQSFFNKCSGLTSVTLNALTNLTQIGDNFFKDCTGLTSVDLRGLTRVTTTGNNFFKDCSNLVTLTAKANTTPDETLSAAIVNAITGVTVNTGYLKDKLTRINLTGNATSLPAWVNNALMTKDTGATLDLSAMTQLTTVSLTNTDIKTVILPTNVTTLTIPSTVTSVSGATGLTRINLVGAAPVPTWATDGSLITTNAILDLSAVTGLGATLNLTGLNTDIINLILPETVNTIQNLPTTVTHLTANVPALASIGAYSSTFPTHITHVTIVDSTTTSIGEGFFYNCGGLTSIDLGALTSLTSINDRFFVGCTSLISVNLSGLTAVTSIGGWFFNNTPSLVTLTAKTNTGANGTLSAATVDAITGQIANKLTRINLTGNATSLPAWVNNTSMTKNTGATLDLSAMTGLLSPFSFATITNAEIKTLILPSGVTQSNTTGWTNSSGTTWTR